MHNVISMMQRQKKKIENAVDNSDTRRMLTKTIDKHLTRNLNDFAKRIKEHEEMTDKESAFLLVALTKNQRPN